MSEEAAAELLRAIRDELVDIGHLGEPVTVGDLLYFCKMGSLVLEDCIERCICQRPRVNRSKQRHERVTVNPQALGLYLRAIVGQRFGNLELQAHYNSDSKAWRYSIADFTPMTSAEKARLLAAPRIEVQPTVSGIRNAGKSIEREEKQRGKAAWELAKLDACVAWAAAQPRDRYGRIIEPKPAPAPAPAPRIERAPRPALCKFGGTGGPGTYSDGRRKCCGRRHD